MNRLLTWLSRVALISATALVLTACPPVTPPGGTVPPITATPTVAPDEIIDLAELEALMATSLGITGTPTATMGIEGVRAFTLTNPIDDGRYWAAYTYGLRNFDPLQSHVVTVYTRQAGRWQELARAVLDELANPEAGTSAPDYVGDGSVTQAAIEPAHLWLQVQGGVGAHGGVYTLFSFDGAALQLQTAGASASPGANRLADLNGDGVLEVLLDATDYYVFCYACGVRRVDYTVMRWDGTQMIALELTPLAESAPAELRALNDQLLQLAQAGLWKDVLATLDATEPLPRDDETLIWNVAYLRLIGTERQAEAQESTAYPILTHIFYGDFDAAVDILRDAGADAIFIPASPLTQGTVAEGWETVLADWVINAVDPALALQPELAAAYFLRGWATYLKTGSEPAALTDVQRAAELAPDEILYTKSVDFLGGPRG
jgi:tetratricopeptide (TPR) repeat protein